MKTLRQQYATKYHLHTENKLQRLTPRFLAQLELCQSEEARRLLIYGIGKSPISDRKASRGGRLLHFPLVLD